MGLCLLLVAGSTVRGGDDTKLYSGKSLEEWQSLIKDSTSLELSAPRTITGLTSIVADVDAPWFARRQAALTLGRVGRPAASAVPVVHRILAGTDDVETQLWTLKSLTYFQTVAAEATEDVALIVLDDSAPHLVRVAAMETLAQTGPDQPLTLRTLIQMLQVQGDSSQSRNELRMAAAEALWLLGPSAAPALSDLIRAAQDRWPLVRLAAVQTIGQIGPQAELAVPTLVDIVLFDDAGEVQEAAADALASLDERGRLALVQLLSDPEIEIRRLAIRGLAILKTAEAASALETALQDDAPVIRVLAAAELLTRQPADAFVEVLLDGLCSTDREVRIESYRALLQDISLLEPFRSRLQQIRDEATSHAQSRTAARHLLRLAETVAR